jgi:hypothetical protein
MRQGIVQFLSAAAIGAALALVGAGSANAESVAKVCGDQWKAAKAAGTTDGKTRAEFIAQCKTEQSGAAAAPAAPAATPAAATAAAPAGGKTKKECNAEYSTNKAAIKAAGQKKADFVASCLAGNETIPPAPAAAAPSAAPAPAPAAAAPAPMAPAPAAAAPKPMAAPSASEMEVKAKCPSDTVVWVNTKSHVYHFAGTRDYGNTKSGEYMCEAAAKSAGSRAAKNETHP